MVSLGLDTSVTLRLLDRIIHADYERDDLQLVTFDRDLARLPGTQLVE